MLVRLRSRPPARSQDERKRRKAAGFVSDEDDSEAEEDVEEAADGLPDWLEVASVRDTAGDTPEHATWKAGSKRKKPSAAASAAATVAALAKDEQTVLYGEWQTDPREQPDDDSVPRNSYGNVDLSHGRALPPGTVHLPATMYPRICAAARQLKIDAPSAMMGFERQGGKSYPIIDGVVVKASDHETLLESYLAIEAAKEEKANAKRVCVCLTASARWL